MAGSLIEPALGLIGAGLAVAGARSAGKQLARDGEGHSGLAGAGLALLFGTLLATALLRAPAPTAHAYHAVIAVMIGYALFHVGIALLIQIFVHRRGRAGYLSARRSAEQRIACLWTDYAAASGIVVLLATHLPGLIA